MVSLVQSYCPQSLPLESSARLSKMFEESDRASSLNVSFVPSPTLGSSQALLDLTLSYLEPLASDASLRLQLRIDSESSCGTPCAVARPESVGGEDAARGRLGGEELVTWQ